jgi:hypothetical protein
MKTIRLAGADIRIYADALTVTVYPEGEVAAYPQATDGYQAQARELGYGTDTARMSRDHELTHHILAHLLGLPCSPTLMGIAISKHATCWREEEAAVLALQKLARMLGVDLHAVAERLATDS